MASSSPPAKKNRKEEANAVNGAEDPAVTLFRNYVRIPSISRGEDYKKHYADAVKFIQDVADDIGLSHELIETAPGNGVVLITVEGTKPELKSVLLNSHYDVVPVFPEFWKYDAFAAHKEENGDIYGRGTQDMKCCTIWYLEAFRRLKKSGVKLARTVYITVMPDEEIAGVLGMKVFCELERFEKMNVGFTLDEGLANPTEAVSVYYGERSPQWIEVTCTGDPGHGSRFIENTAVEKVEKLLRQALAYREEKKAKFNSEACLKLGDVTTLNVTNIHGGVANNVVPNQFRVVMDVRLAPDEDHEAFFKMVQQWLDEAGEGCSLKLIQKNPAFPMTSTEQSDPWWSAFESACNKHSLKIEKEVFPASTDSRYLRSMGIPCLGFSPLNHTPILLHDHNERVNERILIAGVDIFVDIISALANMETV